MHVTGCGSIDTYSILIHTIIHDTGNCTRTSILSLSPWVRHFKELSGWTLLVNLPQLRACAVSSTDAPILPSRDQPATMEEQPAPVGRLPPPRQEKGHYQVQERPQDSLMEPLIPLLPRRQTKIIPNTTISTVRPYTQLAVVSQSLRYNDFWSRGCWRSRSLKERWVPERLISNLV